MNTGVVSRRYAKALLAYVKAVKKEDRVYEEVKMLASYFERVAGLRHAVENPVLDIPTKLKLLREAAGGAKVSQELMRFFSLVLEEKREKFLQFMTWSYIDLYREDKNILIGKLTTAVPSPKLVDYLQRALSKANNAKVELETKVECRTAVYCKKQKNNLKQSLCQKIIILNPVKFQKCYSSSCKGLTPP